MSRFVFKMPDVGEGTAEAEIVKWHVAVGEQVKAQKVHRHRKARGSLLQRTGKPDRDRQPQGNEGS